LATHTNAKAFVRAFLETALAVPTTLGFFLTDFAVKPLNNLKLLPVT